MYTLGSLLIRVVDLKNNSLVVCFEFYHRATFESNFHCELLAAELTAELTALLTKKIRRKSE